jgi:Fe(3+) dicitrate transport protein
VELFARIENLLDEEYLVSRRPAGARPGRPQTALMGVRVNF